MAEVHARSREFGELGEPVGESRAPCAFHAAVNSSGVLPTEGVLLRLSAVIAEHAAALVEIERNEYAELVRMTGGLIP